MGETVRVDFRLDVPVGLVQPLRIDAERMGRPNSSKWFWEKSI
jgi:hypothetical protein